MEFIFSKGPIFFTTFFRMCISVAPYWISGIALGSVITQLLSVEKIKNKRFLYGFKGIVAGSILGIVSPIGLYGALPVSFTLAAAGVPVATIFAFLISTPLINPNLFLFTAGVFGYPMAFARLLSAFVLGITSGCILLLLTKVKQDNLLVHRSLIFDSTRNEHLQKSLKKMSQKGSFKGFVHEFSRYMRFSTPFFLIATTIAAAITVFISPEFIKQLLGSQNRFSILIATLMSIPLYLCGGNTIPFIHELVKSGMTQGAALAFFIAGPATKISNISFLTSILGIRGVVYFLTLTIGASLLFGYWYNANIF